MQSCLHVAIIMDGNGRWARSRGLARLAGHRAGARAVRRVVEAAAAMEISALTLYAFSADNWQRPPAEVAALFELFERYLRTEAARCREHGIRINVIGRRDRLAPQVVAAIEWAEALTSPGERLLLRLAVDYSARSAIAAAAESLSATASPTTSFARALAVAMHALPDTRDVDLLIRTSGEQRLSDFLLWEVAYAELYFTRRAWPDFDAEDLQRAVDEFAGRERRFGRILEDAV